MSNSSSSQSYTSSRSFSIENLVEGALETGRNEDAESQNSTVSLEDAASAFSQPGKQNQNAQLDMSPRQLSQEAIESASNALPPDWSIDSPQVGNWPTATVSGVGIRSLPRQLCKKSIRRGYDFKLMLVGESGIGKTTMIDSLFNVDSTRNLGSAFVAMKTESTTRLCERFFELEEGGVTVRLSVIDTPGFANELDCSTCLQPVVDYIDKQLDEYFRLEQGLERSKLLDGRVHALLYLINPSCRGLKPLDIWCLRALHRRVNIVPIIAKADTLTRPEKERLKARILEDLAKHQIVTYQLPDFDDCFMESEFPSNDVYLRDQYSSLKMAMPLAVIGASSLVKSSDGVWLRVREYPWGVVDIENPEFSDFLKLRELLILYMEDLKDRTHEVIYEEIRLRRIRQSNHNMIHLSQTLSARERLLEEKDAELRKLQEEIAQLSKTQSMPPQRQRREVPPVPSTSSLYSVDLMHRTSSQVDSARRIVYNGNQHGNSRI